MQHINNLNVQEFLKIKPDLLLSQQKLSFLYDKWIPHVLFSKTYVRKKDISVVLHSHCNGITSIFQIRFNLTHNVEI